MGLTKREYIARRTSITSQNMNDIQDAIIALEKRTENFPDDAHINELIDAKLAGLDVVPTYTGKVEVN